MCWKSHFLFQLITKEIKGLYVVDVKSDYYDTGANFYLECDKFPYKEIKYTDYCVHYGESMYAASKGAISGFAKGAALDLSRSRIRVNSVCPGIVKTNIFNGAIVIIHSVQFNSVAQSCPTL